MIRTTEAQRLRTEHLINIGEQKTLSPAPQSPECLRCGQCCHYLTNGRVVPCRFLRNLPNGLTYCHVYYRRKTVKPVPGLNAYCLDRKDSKYDFPGCPYNTGKPFRKN